MSRSRTIERSKESTVDFRSPLSRAKALFDEFMQKEVRQQLKKGAKPIKAYIAEERDGILVFFIGLPGTISATDREAWTRRIAKDFNVGPAYVTVVNRGVVVVRRPEDHSPFDGEDLKVLMRLAVEMTSVDLSKIDWRPYR